MYVELEWKGTAIGMALLKVENRNWSQVVRPTF